MATDQNPAHSERQFCWCPTGETSHRFGEGCPRNGVNPASFSLCGECGCITFARDWTAWNHAEDRDELVPAPDGDEGNYYRCPACGYDHRDDDSDPGVWEGGLEEMKAERAANTDAYGWDAPDD